VNRKNLTVRSNDEVFRKRAMFRKKGTVTEENCRLYEECGRARATEPVGSGDTDCATVEEKTGNQRREVE
jgi:hypothetical protein